MKDLSTDIETLFQRRMMQCTPSERVSVACRMFDAAKALAGAGIEQQYGKLPAHDMRIRLLHRFYSEDFSPDQLDTIARRLATEGKDAGAGE